MDFLVDDLLEAMDAGYFSSTYGNSLPALQSSILNFVRTPWSVCPVKLASPLVFNFIALLSARKEPAEFCAG
jgi:hypothetical protein